MRVIISGGGTGGHLYPGLAIARGLQRQFPEAEILFVGTPRGLEARVVPEEGFPFVPVEVKGWTDRRLSWSTLKSGFAFAKGLREAARIIKNFSPRVVIGTGGYVCVPVVLAACWQGIPALLHEQNAFPGLANRFLSRWADAVMLTFSEAERFFPKACRTVHTGLPVRPEILQRDRRRGAAEWGLDPGKITVLSMGGSQGARSINCAMLEVVEYFCRAPEWQLIHATGPGGYDEFMEALSLRGLKVERSGNIRIVPYLYRMEHALAAADLAVCRAGASTLAEITACGIPAILIPYPYAADNHQAYNARVLEEKGAAVVIPDSSLNGELLLKTVQGLLENKEQLYQMARQSLRLAKPQALDLILREVTNVLERA